MYGSTAIRIEVAADPRVPVHNAIRERIRQIEVRAFEKLQKTMKRLAKEQGLPVGD